MIEKNLASVRQLSCDHGLFRHLPSLFTPTSVYAPGATAPQTFTGEGRGGFAPDRLRQTHGARGAGVTWSRLVGQVAPRLRWISLEETAHLAWLLRRCYPVVLTEAQVADIVRQFAVDWLPGLKQIVLVSRQTRWCQYV